jgi:hypothetical protein
MCKRMEIRTLSFMFTALLLKIDKKMDKKFRWPMMDVWIRKCDINI